MHFLVEKEGLYAGDPTCVRLINHLQKHYDQLNKNNGKDFNYYSNFHTKYPVQLRYTAPFPHPL